MINLKADVVTALEMKNEVVIEVILKTVELNFAQLTLNLNNLPGLNIQPLANIILPGEIEPIIVQAHPVLNINFP